MATNAVMHCGLVSVLWGRVVDFVMAYDCTKVWHSRDVTLPVKRSLLNPCRQTIISVN